MNLSLAEFQALRKVIAAWSGLSPAQLPRGLQEAYVQTTLGASRYVWAFSRLHDALITVAWKDQPGYQPYPQPRSIDELSRDYGYRRFPMDQQATVDILMFEGAEICLDPRFGPGPSAGSIATEAPHLIPRRDWWRYLSHGYERGVGVVAVLPHTRSYRFSRATLVRVWDEAKETIQRQANDSVFEVNDRLDQAAKRRLEYLIEQGLEADDQMSYDLRIYFQQTAFPLEPWAEILRLFDFTPSSTASDFYEREWQAEQETTVWLSLSQMKPDQPQLCAPSGTHWLATISTGMGRSPQAVWTQFAVPYYALGLMTGVSVHDCQWHTDDNAAHFDTPEAYLAFAAQAIGRLIQKRWLIRQGCMSPEGIPLF
jgi:hypothetical protein